MAVIVLIFFLLFFFLLADRLLLVAVHVTVEVPLPNSIGLSDQADVVASAAAAGFDVVVVARGATATAVSETQAIDQGRQLHFEHSSTVTHRHGRHGKEKNDN